MDLKMESARREWEVKVMTKLEDLNMISNQIDNKEMQVQNVKTNFTLQNQDESLMFRKAETDAQDKERNLN